MHWVTSPIKCTLRFEVTVDNTTMASVPTMAYTVKIQGNISVLSTSTSELNPELLLEGPFSTFAEFEKNLQEYEKATFAAFRKNNTTSVQSARKYLKHSMPDEIVYHRAQFVCTHYGSPRYRGKGIINNTTTLATGCEAEIVLLWNNTLQKLVVTKKNLTHNHEMNAFTYSQQYKVKRLTAEQREELKELVQEDIRGAKLRDTINERFGKCFSLRDTRVLKYQLKKEMGLARSRAPHKLDPSLSDDGGSLIGGAADLLEDSTLEQVEDTANRSRSTARRSRAEIDEATLLSGPLNLSDMSEFVRYLDASNRLKTKRRNGDSGFIEIAEPAFSIRRANASSLKKVKVECPDDEETGSKDAQVCADLPTDMPANAGFCVVVEKKAPVFENTESSVTNNVPNNNAMTITTSSTTTTNTSTSNSNDKSTNINSCATDSVSFMDPDSGLGAHGMEASRNFHFFMDLCRQLDTLSPRKAVAARRELSDVLHKYMIEEIEWGGQNTT
ncbi:far1 DNA-binding domain [Plakobranchus ocellatus]|uniref:Far1 DNA-binding domain n=1 Tax=Plakobranchus ocellatus TaxID=259542 RepID=A0AAV4CDE8_9GAST|nr:far1 DNA-binding domain [Plakobranchus ocellatus]